MTDNPTPRHHIRKARPEDAADLARLIRVLGYHADGLPLPERLAAYGGEHSRVFVAVREGSMAGFASFHAIPMFHEPAMLGRITAMAIDPACRREGIGAALVAAAEEFALAAGCTRMEVTSGDHREQDAHLFYNAQGYASDCRRFLKRLTSPGSGGGGDTSKAALS